MDESMHIHTRKGGRPSLLTPELTQKICSFIMAGAYDYSAAEASGISGNTFREWLGRGEGRDRERPSDKRFATFATSIRLAKANARVAALEMVRQDRVVGSGR
jgi:hypothetical protein